jgi:hypothetical protein
MLKLIVSQDISTPEVTSYSREIVQPIQNEPFSAHIHPKGPLLYIMTAKDPSHYLDCELTLEIESNQNESNSSVVICHFPKILDEQLACLIEDDDTLFGIILIHFQMKIFEQLLLFCTHHYASSLIIYADDATAGDLGVYRDFLTFWEQNVPENEGSSELVVPISQEIYADWMNYMNELCLKFRQTLWQDQRKNLAIKNYLKSHPFG